MGSGRGQVKRTQSASTAPMLITGEAEFRRGDWNGFLTSNDVASMPVFEYYIGDFAIVLGENDYGGDDYKKLVSDLFADAVAVGAITLPEQLCAEDIAFRMYPMMVDGEWSRNIRVELKDKADLMVTPVAMPFESEDTMISPRISEMLARIADAINDLVIASATA